MLRATLLRRARAHTPLIKFPDRKGSAASSSAHEPHPHPAAPKEIDFQHFKEVYQSGPHFDPSKVQSPSALAASSSSSSGSAGSKPSAAQQGAAEDLHDLPERFWKTPAMMIEEVEMEAINSGGASLRP